MEKYSKDLFRQIMEIIRDVKTSKSNDSQEIKRKLVELKKKFCIFRQNQRSSAGRLNEKIINKILLELSELRKLGYGNEANINEILQIIAHETKEQGDLEKTKQIHTDILGYEGTNCNDMEPEYIKEIIYRKLDRIKDTSIGKDIINILLDAFQSSDLAKNLEQYKELIEDAIIPLLSRENKDLADRRIITVLSKLAKEYKARGDYANAFELCEIGKELEQFGKTDEYNELLKEHESLDLYLTLEKNFRKVKIDMKDKSLAEAIREALGKNGVIDVEKGRRRYIFKRNKF